MSTLYYNETKLHQHRKAASMLKFLHISDIHLNSGFSNKNEMIRMKLKRAIKSSFEQAVEYTIEQNLEGLLVAGDMFDHEFISYEDEKWLKAQLFKLLDNAQKIFYVTGNHDPMNTISFIRELKASEYFYYIDSDEVQQFNLISRQAEPYRVIGVGHISKNEQRNLIQNFPLKHVDETWVGIAHASVPSALSLSGKKDYMATTLNQIELLNYDYFALGHIHVRQILSDRIAYSGNLQGLNIKETGFKGGLLITLDRGQTHIEPVNFQNILWDDMDVEITLEIENVHDFEALMMETILRKIETAHVAAKNVILRLNVKGQSHVKKSIQDITYFEERLKGETGILDLEIRLDGLKLPKDVNALRLEKTVLADVLNRIMFGNYEEELIEKIKKIKVFENETREEIQSKLKDMRDELLDEAVERMVVNHDH